MARVEKFAFGRDFGKSGPKKQEVHVKAVGGEAPATLGEGKQVLTDADLCDAELSGFERGKREGLEEGRQRFYQEGLQEGARLAREEMSTSVASETFKLVDKVQTTIELHVKEREAHYQDLGETGLQIAIAVLKKTFPLYEERSGYEELKHQINQVIVQLIEEEKIELEISGSHGEESLRQLRKMFENQSLRDKVQIKSRSDMSKSDLLLKWRGGSLDRSVERIMASVEKLAASGSR